MSNPIEGLAAKVEELRSEILGLSEIPELDETQEARWAAANAEFDTAKADYEAAEARAAKIEAVRATVTKTETSNQAPAVHLKRDHFADLGELRYQDPESDAVIERATAAFEGTKLRGVKTEHVEGVLRAIDEIPGAAVHALVHGSPAYRSAINHYMKTSGNPIWNDQERDAVRTALSLTGANGGYTLPTLLDPTLIHTGTAVKDPIRSIARVETGTQNVWHGVSVGNVTTYWKGEGSAFTDGNPTLSNPSVTAAMLTAYLPGSFEVFEDSDLQRQLPGLVAESMSYAEQTAFISGSGSTAPRGIVTAISATAGSTVTVTTRGAFTSASSADVFALLEAIPSRYEDSANWVANKHWFNTVRQMSTGSNGSLFWTDLGSGSPLNLLGSPLRQASDMNTSFASGSVIAIFGDFSQYLIFDRIGLQVEFMQQVVDGNGLPTGQRGFVCHKRVGGDVTDVNAFRFLKA